MIFCMIWSIKIKMINQKFHDIVKKVQEKFRKYLVQLQTIKSKWKNLSIYYKTTEKDSRFFLQALIGRKSAEREKIAMLAFVMLALGFTNVYLVENQTNKVYAHPPIIIEETATATNSQAKISTIVGNKETIESTSTIPTEPIEEEVWEPSAIYLNLSKKFPEGVDTNDVTKSYAGQVFHEIFALDGEWYSDILSQLDKKPDEMAKKLGLSPEHILGKYDITDKEHNPLQPETWKVKKWSEVKVNIHDANGSILENSSNLKEIMAMASVYGYYHGWENYELFLKYAKQLWNSSRSHHFSMSNISYDGVGITEDRISSAIQEGNGKLVIDYFVNKKAKESNTESSIEIENTNTESNTIESTTSSNTESSQYNNTNIDIEISTEVNSETINTEETFIATSSDATRESQESENITTSMPLESISEIDTKMQAVESRFEVDANGNVVFSKNPGKLNLSLDINVYKLSGKKNLFTIDQMGNNKKHFNENWQGWTEDKIAQVRELYEQDWYKEYGLTVSSFSTGKPLTAEEKSAYLSELPADLSEERRKVISYALDSVGYVPYYFGGKPSAPNYDANNFYTIIAPDYKGRVFKGLDCSGWVNWVVWSAIGNRMPAYSTSSFIHAGHGIDRASLRPGDIVVRSGRENSIGHIVIFLKWDSDGDMICIHETGQPQNNVVVSKMQANWTYRNILD